MAQVLPVLGIPRPRCPQLLRIAPNLTLAPRSFRGSFPLVQATPH